MNNCKELGSLAPEQSLPALPESCNSLLALSSFGTGPVLHRRTQLTTMDSGEQVEKFEQSNQTDSHCDPCSSKSLFPEQSQAVQKAKDSQPSKVWINAGFLTYHPTDHSGQFNDLNYGIGLEYEKSRNVSFAVGEYKNSVRHNSFYGMIEYQPLHLGNFKAGIAGGAISGYPEMNHGKPFPAALPVVSYEQRHAGVNVVYIPQVKGVVPAISMQLKFRF